MSSTKTSTKTATKSAKPLPTEKNNQLIYPDQFSVDNLNFSDPVEGAIPNSTLKSRRVMLSYSLPDGSVSDVLIPTERVFSYGPQENTDQATNKLNGYSLSLVLLSKDGATPGEQKFLDTVVSIVEKAKDHMMDNKALLKLDKNMVRSELRKLLSCLYYKKGEDGEPLPGVSPTLYAKLITTDSSKKKKKGTEEKKEEPTGPSIKIVTQFFSKKTGLPIDPITLIQKWGYVKAVVKFESIFFGAQIRLQCKCVEVEYDPMESSFKPLLPRANAGMLLNTSSMNSFARNVAQAELKEAKEPKDESPKTTKEEPGSLNNSDAEEEPEEKKVVAKPARKVTVVKKAPKKE